MCYHNFIPVMTTGLHNNNLRQGEQVTEDQGLYSTLLGVKVWPDEFWSTFTFGKFFDFVLNQLKVQMCIYAYNRV